MGKSYFDHILAQCLENDISFACSVFQTKDSLCNAAHAGFNGESRILGQGRLIYAAKGLLGETGFVRYGELDSDAKHVYSKTAGRLSKIYDDNAHMRDVDYELLFDVLVDLNWLLASKWYYDQKDLHGKVKLLESFNEAQSALKAALYEVVYNTAQHYLDREEQYSSRTRAAFRLFPAAHPDPEVRELNSRGYTTSDFKRFESDARSNSIDCMALFFALTATAIREKELWEEEKK